MIYYATYAALLLAAYMGQSGRDIRQLLYWLILVGLFLFVGYRYEVGCDWGGYLENYRSPLAHSYDDAVATREPAHWGLILLLHNFGAPYQYLNVVAAGLFFLGIHAVARRQPNPLAFLVLCFPILILNMPMSAIRQGAAIGFLCLAYLAVIDRRLTHYVIWVLLGSAFHQSALIFLLIAPYIKGKANLSNAVIAAILAIPGAYSLLQMEAAAIAQARYIDTELEATGAAFRLGILSLTGLFFLMILAPSWRQRFPKDYKLVMVGAWMMVGFFSLFFLSSVIGDRFGYYLIPIQAMIFARIPYLPLGDYRKFYAFAPYAGLTLVFVVWTQLSWHFEQCYLPYQFAFS